MFTHEEKEKKVNVLWLRKFVIENLFKKDIFERYYNGLQIMFYKTCFEMYFMISTI